MQVQIAQHQVWNSVKELLHRHDCVIVPNFGGFVCNTEHSRIDQVSHVINPPAKRVVFNQNLKTNDGLLAQTVSQQLAITYSEALRTIDELVTQLRQHLEQLKQLDIEAFGSFRLNADANYVFLPDKHNTYLHSSFGLLPLQAVPVSGQLKGARHTRIFKDRKEVREVRKIARARNIGLKMLTFTLACMLLLNGYIFLTDANLIGGAKINTTGINSWFDSLIKPEQPDVKPAPAETPVPVPESPIPASPVPSETDSLVEQPQYIELEQIELKEDMRLLNLAEVFAATGKTAPGFNWQPAPLQPTDAGTISPAPELPVITNNPAEETNTVTSGKTYSYHVIGGVFCKERNARRFYKKLREKGFEAELLLNERINCNRVSYRKLSSLEEAIQLMDSLKVTENPEAWVLTVKE